MKKIIFIGLVIIPFACSKTKDTYIAVGEDYDKVSVSLQVIADSDTRALSSDLDSRIDDINIWFFHQQMPDYSLHIYTGSVISNLSLPEGDYEVFIIANYGEDMGSKISEELSGLTFSESQSQKIIDDRQRLLMSIKTYIRIKSNGSDHVNLDPIIVDRCIAEINFKLDVDPDERSNWAIHSIQFKNLSKTSEFFEPDISSNEETRFYDSPTYQVTGNYSTKFYILENKRGLSDHSIRTKFTSPDFSTYAEIKATYSKGSTVKDVTHRVYFGMNQVEDYNVRRNSRYSFDCFLTVPLYGNVGDIYYSDHTISSRIESGKTPIGIVASQNLIVGFETYSGPATSRWNILESHIWGQVWRSQAFETPALAVTDMDGYGNTVFLCFLYDIINNAALNPNVRKAQYYSTEGTVRGQWFIPSAGQLNILSNNRTKIEATWKLLGLSGTFWSNYMSCSTYNGSYGWSIYYDEWIGSNSTYNRSHPVMEY